MTPAIVRGTISGGAYFGRRYRIVRAISAGGMGAVYEVFDEVTEGPRALKVMLPSVIGSAEHEARFAQEARVTGGIESEHLVRITDAGVESGVPFIVMDLLRGEDLRSVIQKSGRLPSELALTYLRQVALALEKTHAANIVHRDLKPANLFLSRRDDGTPCVKILDFGVAKLARNAAAQETSTVGTPLYMAPEQARGDGGIGARADLLALAHVAYTMLTGEAYFTDELERSESIVGLFMAVANGPTEAPSVRAMRRRTVWLPATFDAWFLRAAAADPATRFSGAREQVDALAAALEGRAAPVRVRTAPMQAVALSSTAPPTARSAAPITAAPTTARSAEPIAAASTVISAGEVRTRRVLPWRWLLGGLALAAVVVIGFVAVVTTGGDSHGRRKKRATPSAAPFDPGCVGARCRPFEPDDLTSVEPVDYLGDAFALAKEIDPSARFAMLTVIGTIRDGKVDTTSEAAPIIFQFVTKTGLLTVSVQGGRLIAFAPTETSGLPAPLEGAPCPLARAWAAARAGGLPPKFERGVSLMSMPYYGQVWLFSTGDKTYFVDARTCALKLVD